MNHQPSQPRYPVAPHKLDRRSRPEQVVKWIIQNIEADGGTSTFVGFGRWAKRLFGKVEAMLPPGYECLLVRYSSDSRLETTKHRLQRHEVRLQVTAQQAPPDGDNEVTEQSD